MKAITKILAAVSAAAVLAGNPLIAGDGKTFKEKVVVEETNKWWGATLSTGWDSLYMFRGVNIIRGDLSYGSGLYWTDLNATWNISENDFLNAGVWTAFGTQKTDYKEFDAYVKYTRTIGDLSLSMGYIFYYVWSAPLYSHELNWSAAYAIDLGFATITPSLTYFLNLGPDTGADQGIAPTASSYLLPRVDMNIPITDWLAIAPWTAFGINFGYNADANGDFFNGGNNYEIGIGLPIQINEIISIYLYGAYSYQWNDLVGTRPNTFWGGGKIGFTF
jgi:hypothetical protein